MIIKQSQVHMSAEHQKTEYSSVTTSTGVSIEQAKAQAFAAEMDISWLEQQRGMGDIRLSNIGLSQQDPLEQAQQSQRKLFSSLIDALFRKQPDYGSGKERYPFQPMGASASPADSTLQLSAGGLALPGDGAELPVMPVRTIKVDISMTETIEEYECSSFNACGVVKTADGREIAMDLSVSMERSYKATRTYTETHEMTFTDPLVLHFEGHSTELTEETYAFDLDMDGEEDRLRFVDAASAFLALDKNGDGIINNGGELFGAESGNGFRDLAEYDDDGNGYIDEADAIFSELKLWSKATDGSDILESLADRGVGAIYLGASETPFDVKDSDNAMQARVRSSGFFLKESGEAGTVQQIDMVS